MAPLDVAAPAGVVGADTPPTHSCAHCGTSFPARNALFRHLKERCSPDIVRLGRKEERVALVVGFVGSSYHGCVLNHTRDEKARPTVEGAIVAAVHRAWGDVFLRLTRATKTEKGAHASENVVVLTVKPSPRCDAALRRELEGSSIWLLAPAGARVPPGSLFDKVYDAKKRVFRYYVPFFALLPASPSAEDAGEPGDVEGLWVSNLPPGCTAEDVVALLAEHGGVAVDTGDITIHPDQGCAEVSLDAGATACARYRLHRRAWRGRSLVALPCAEVRGKKRILKRMRSSLKALRGPAKGLRDFHNFIVDGAPRTLASMRQLQNCTPAGVDQEISGERCADGSWAESDWTFSVFSAKDFGPQQLRRMMGALVAVVRGNEDAGYIERCFTDQCESTLPAPSESVVLEGVVLGQWGADWRSAVGVDPASVDSSRMRIEEHILANARQPWQEFIARLDAGDTRAHLTRQLHDAAAAGDVDCLEDALGLGARLDGTNEYGQTAALLAAQTGHADILRALAAAGADLGRPANGGSSPAVVAAALGHSAAAEELRSLGADLTLPGSEGKTAADHFAEHAQRVESRLDDRAAATSSPQRALRTVVLREDLSHPGAGAVTVDTAFDDEFLARLEHLRRLLPIARKTKDSPTDRAYFADTEGWVVRRLDAAVAAAGMPQSRALPLMRFLIYLEPGG